MCGTQVLLAQELKKEGIPVLLIHPGFNKTGMTAKCARRPARRPRAHHRAHCASPTPHPHDGQVQARAARYSHTYLLTDLLLQVLAHMGGGGRRGRGGRREARAARGEGRDDGAHRHVHQRRRRAPDPVVRRAHAEYLWQLRTGAAWDIGGV